jgi:hypothetical protein
MNERIKELWIKAAREDSSETWDTQEQFIERFAQLIVAECIDVLKDTGYPNAHGNCVGVEELKQHFGVDIK